jgi:hypothetical protein
MERYWSMTLTDSALFMPERTPEEGRPVCSTASVEGDPKKTEGGKYLWKR